MRFLWVKKQAGRNLGLPQVMGAETGRARLQPNSSSSEGNEISAHSNWFFSLEQIHHNLSRFGEKYKSK